MDDKRKLEVFDTLLGRYLSVTGGYGYASMAMMLKDMFTKEEIIDILAEKYPDEDKNIIIREVNKEYGIWPKN